MQFVDGCGGAWGGSTVLMGPCSSVGGVKVPCRSPASVSSVTSRTFVAPAYQDLKDQTYVKRHHKRPGVPVAHSQTALSKAVGALGQTVVKSEPKGAGGAGTLANLTSQRPSEKCKSVPPVCQVMRKQSTAPQLPISQRTACPDASGTMLCMPATPGSAVFKRVLGAQRTKDGFVSQRRGAQVALAEPPAAICRIGGQCAGERKSEL